MIVSRTMDPHWLSNSWLVGDKPGGHAVLIDTGGPMQGIVDCIEEHCLTLTHVLCTHHHPDHVTHNADYRHTYGCPVCGHGAERSLFGDLDLELQDGDELVAGDLHVRALHIPGHTLGQLGFVINDERVFTGDTLFRGSVGGTRGRGHTTFEDLQHSIMDVLMRLPHQTVVHPGHTDETTIGREWQENPFVLAWRGEQPMGKRRCRVNGMPAVALLRVRDYDGGTKVQVRFDEGDELAVVPGSRVRLEPGQ